MVGTMPLCDHSDDHDFYTQGFERNGVVSVWAGLRPADDRADVDVLQDLCGVGYYALSDQEGQASDGDAVSLGTLIEPLSYASSYLQAVVARAGARGVTHAHWLTVQYDFAYHPMRVTRPITDDPVFLGVFDYRTE